MATRDKHQRSTSSSPPNQSRVVADLYDGTTRRGPKTGRRLTNVRVNHRGKKLFDLLISVSVLIVGAPLWLLFALAIKVDSRGPVIFRQSRIGLDGREFIMYKFRSMVTDADSKEHEKAFEKYANGVSVEEDDQGARFKAARDPRVTRVGQFLRSTNLDEVPQLFNIIKGEMSIVGPRPAIPYELKWYEDWHHQRFDVLPGIAGLWQLTDRYRVGMNEMMRLDIEYVKKRNIFLDLKISSLTVLLIMRECVIAIRGKKE